VLLGCALPGPKRPGLIEATVARRGALSSTTPSPGPNARASLKHQHVLVAPPHGLRPSPGPNARASLKLGSQVQVHLAAGPSPGPNARASLKHARGRCCRPRSGSLPGPKRPGLIEATSSRRRCSGPSTPSPGPNARASLKRVGAEVGDHMGPLPLPGPKRPGLIEAW